MISHSVLNKGIVVVVCGLTAPITLFLIQMLNLERRLVVLFSLIFGCADYCCYRVVLVII